MWRVIKNRAWLPLSCFTHKLFVTLNDTALFGSPSRWLETDEIVFTIVFEMSRWLSKFLFTDSAQHISRCREMSRYWDDSTLFFNTFLTSMLTLMSRCYSWQIISHFLKHWISQIFLHQTEHHDARITRWCPASGSMVWINQNWFYKIHLFLACVVYFSFQPAFIFLDALDWSRSCIAIGSSIVPPIHYFVIFKMIIRLNL